LKIFDLKEIRSYPYSQRDKNVFYEADGFKTRIIDLDAGEEIPDCQMESYVIFYVINGEAIITVDSHKSIISSGKCLITEPAVISLRSETGARIVGIQIKK
jgi:mannose-6-phosphate isomerase-like protein (cupin superfamily)